MSHPAPPFVPCWGPESGRKLRGGVLRLLRPRGVHVRARASCWGEPLPPWQARPLPSESPEGLRVRLLAPFRSGGPTLFLSLSRDFPSPGSQCGCRGRGPILVLPWPTQSPRAVGPARQGQERASPSQPDPGGGVASIGSLLPSFPPGERRSLEATRGRRTPGIGAGSVLLLSDHVSRGAS